MIPRYHFRGGGIIFLSRKTPGSGRSIRRPHLLPRDPRTAPGQANTVVTKQSPGDRACPFCQGTGKCNRRGGGGTRIVRQKWWARKRLLPCSRCAGTGKCELCQGTGSINREDSPR